MRLSRRELVIAGLGGLSTILAACGSAAPATSTASTPATKGGTATTAPATASPKSSATTAPTAASTSTAAAAGAAATTAPSKATGAITVYSGRSKTLVEPLFEQFTKATGVEIKPRYGDSAELAAALLEEGKNSPADAFFAQDAGALGAVAAKGHLAALPEPLLTRVEERFRSPQGEWVGLSGRARVVVYNTKELKDSDLPDTIQGFTDATWKDKLGWPPTNASFQAFVTAMRILDGEEAARQWLLGIKANNPQVYKNNTAAVEATGKGEILAAFVNHYYLFGFLKDQGESFAARNYHPRSGGAGAIINVAGAGVLTTAKNAEGARAFIDYLLSEPAQQYFTEQTFEYPLIPGIKTNPLLTPLAEIKTPDIDLSKLSDLEATLKLLRDTSIL